MRQDHELAVGAGDVDDVYERIAAELLDVAASVGEVVYAVPGNPAVAERRWVGVGCDRGLPVGGRR